MVNMEVSLDEALRLGVEAHKAGKAQEAEQYYAAILKAQPGHMHANHNMGVLAVGVGKIEESIPFFTKAVEANKNMAQFWLSLIDAFVRLERIAEAQDTLKQAKRNGVKGEAFDQLEKKILAPHAQKHPPDEIQQRLVNLYKLGKYKEVLQQLEPLFADYPNSFILHNMSGVANTALNQLDAAVKSLERAIKVNPGYSEAHSNLGSALKARGEVDLAIKCFTDALQIDPKNIAARFNKALAHQLTAGYGDAIKEYEMLIKLGSKDPVIFFNMGINFKILKDFDNAQTNFIKAFNIKPDYSLAYQACGHVLIARFNHEQAIKIYRKGLLIDPNLGASYNNLALSLAQLGFIEQSIFEMHKAIKVNADNRENFHNLVAILKAYEPNHFSQTISDSYLRVLNYPNVARPNELASGIAKLLKKNEEIQSSLNEIKKGNSKINAVEICQLLLKFPLFVRLMEVCPVQDLELEKLLLELRKSFLLDREKYLKDTSQIPFQIALALQCFTNEYIYLETESETLALSHLESSIDDAYSRNKLPSTYQLACLASYRPLHKYSWSNQLMDHRELSAIVRRHVVDILKENELGRNIKRLPSVKDEVSQLVKEQYEESPYPRWINTQLSDKPLTIRDIFALMQGRVSSQNTEILTKEAPDVLVAGCGTGQHALAVATRIKDCKVTALDLSIKSLSYAKRKTAELALDNIEYLQGDILNVQLLNKKFDIIESAGVLHHLNDPVEGWSVLTNVLKPYGFMKIGLYSRLARAEIIKARQTILERNILSTREAMILFRKDIIDGKYPKLQYLHKSFDFYSLSSFRDLLFHVQEHTFTLPQIDNILETLGLTFCGFSLVNNRVKDEFKKTYSQPDDIYNLHKWGEFEQQNPKTFAGMYQFWVQKTS